MGGGQCSSRNVEPRRKRRRKFNIFIHKRYKDIVDRIDEDSGR